MEYVDKEKSCIYCVNNCCYYVGLVNYMNKIYENILKYIDFYN